jgi:hypothetical protein
MTGTTDKDIAKALHEIASDMQINHDERWWVLWKAATEIDTLRKRIEEITRQ